MTARRGSGFRAFVIAPRAARARPPVTCPTCAAHAGDRCYRTASWVPDDTHEAGGFYTERTDRVHADRVATAGAAVVKPVDPRKAIRHRIYGLVTSKLAGHGRMQARQWAGSTRRTVAELDAKLAELEAMPDLPW